MLQQAGAAGYRQMITDDIILARQLARLVSERDQLELVTQHLSVTTFRFVPRDLAPSSDSADTRAYLDTLNRNLLDRLQLDGQAFVSNAIVEGRYVLRACVVNFHTSAGDIDAVPDIVVTTGEAVDRRLRP